MSRIIQASVLICCGSAAALPLLGPKARLSRGSGFCNVFLWVGLTVAPDVQGENDDGIAIAG